jgi:hypothetical protein
MIARRGFFGGLGALLAAPAIIRSPGLLMPVKPVFVPPEFAMPCPALKLPQGMLLTVEDYAERYMTPAIATLWFRMVERVELETIYG